MKKLIFLFLGFISIIFVFNVQAQNLYTKILESDGNIDRCYKLEGGTINEVISLKQSEIDTLNNYISDHTADIYLLNQYLNKI